MNLFGHKSTYLALARLRMQAEYPKYSFCPREYAVPSLLSTTQALLRLALAKIP